MTAIPADELYPWMSFQPLRQGLCRALWQEIKWATRFQIDEQGAISLPLQSARSSTPRILGVCDACSGDLRTILSKVSALVGISSRLDSLAPVSPPTTKPIAVCCCVVGASGLSAVHNGLPRAGFVPQKSRAHMLDDHRKSAVPTKGSPQEFQYTADRPISAGKNCVLFSMPCDMPDRRILSGVP